MGFAPTISNDLARPHYPVPFKSIKVDAYIEYEKVLYWHDVPVIPIHTPGHCYAHASYHLVWENVTIFCTGDVLQYGKGTISAQQAEGKAFAEYDIFNKSQRIESDFDKAVKSLQNRTVIDKEAVKND